MGIDRTSTGEHKDSLDIINSGDNRDSRDSPTSIESHLNVGDAIRKAICEGIVWQPPTQ